MQESPKSIVAHDLEQKGYHVVSGSKFGADFIIYKEDIDHSIAVISLFQRDSVIPIQYELASLARIASNVKKSGYLAIVDGGTVEYLSVKQEKVMRDGKSLSFRNKTKTKSDNKNDIKE